MADGGPQRLTLRALLSLPTPILRSLAGGGVVHRGGRTLDARYQFLAAAARGQPAMSTLTPEEARAGSAAGLAAVAGRPARGVVASPASAPGPAGAVPVRLYRPDDQDPAVPVMVFAHFGGGVIGDLETCHAFCGLLARMARAPVVSVDYRLAPEHRFPAALDDVTAVYRWACEHAGGWGAAPGVAAIGGDSMGGDFAAVLAQDLKRAGAPQPVLQLLIYPCLDVASELPSMITYADAYPLSAATMRWFMGHYMGADDDPADPRLSPLRAADLAGLAPAIIATAGFDPLLDEGETYAHRLVAAGVPVTYRRYDALAHGFTAFTGAVPAAQAACLEIAGLVRQAYEERSR